MARKGVTVQESLETNDEFEAYLANNHDKLICIEVYSEFCGHCLATAFAVRRGKLEIGQDRVAMARAAADKIDAFSRFRNKSEPVFLFISKGKLSRAMFGANGIEFCRILEEELELTQQEVHSGTERPRWNIHEPLPEETAREEEHIKLAEQRRLEEEQVHAQTVAARKKRIAERLAAHLRRYNFIVFWPHCHQAHFDLYEKWGVLDIQVSAKEEVQFTEDAVRELVYMSDLDVNEACLHALMAGDALLVLFKMYETDDRNFVEIMRHALYEEIPEPKEDQDTPPQTAFNTYATISKTKREVRRDRYNARMQKLREEREERQRLAAEQARLAREAEEDRIRLETQRREEERMARIQAGLPDEPEPEPDVTPEEVVEGGETEVADTEHVAEEEEVLEEEFHSDVSVEGEAYIPAGGLLVPGLYCPPNDLAKANALAYFFPKVVSTLTTLESEHLPAHALVVFPADKRHQVQEVMQQHPHDILNYGMFVGEDPTTAEHVAYTVRQYDKLDRMAKHKDRVAVMVSVSRSLPLLQLAALGPTYISPDGDGEADCRALFPVGYGDDYVEEIENEEILSAQDSVTAVY
ncbi:uncharacterized protein LOC121737492 [Aricia agestis]|uniref:uncharacterized protein LOC121737492 n=1 Tax=Aricia agestis TaxID=91739 RepID=UPI001C20610E|nr:uncharacterized protein LOC121737492 [Aricia agestis]